MIRCRPCQGTPGILLERALYIFSSGFVYLRLFIFFIYLCFLFFVLFDRVFLTRSFDTPHLQLDNGRLRRGGGNAWVLIFGRVFGDGILPHRPPGHDHRGPRPYTGRGVPGLS